MPRYVYTRFSDVPPQTKREEKQQKRGKIGRLLEIEKFAPKFKGGGLQLIGEIESFISPVDNKPVTNRRELQAHNRTHDVVDQREFRGHDFEKAKPKLPPVAPDLAQVFKEKTGRF